jgi:cytochrome c oxidase subunit 1
MTITEDRPAASDDAPPPARPTKAHVREPTGILRVLTSSDHKAVGAAYMVTAFGFYLVGGAMAEAMRGQLAKPANTMVDTGTYNELFTMHGTIMLLFFLGSFAFGLGNFLIPLQIGARDMAFPRLNQISYWIYLTSGLITLSGFFTSNGAANFGWFAYTPLSDGVRSPGIGGDLWVAGVALVGISGILTAVNFITTIVTMRAPGMTMFRMPIFVWNMLVVSVLILAAFPVLTAAGAMLYADRHFGGHIFDAGTTNGVHGVPILWQHLFWFFGHPEVYILILPYFGVVTEVFSVFSRKPVFGYKGFVFATVSIGALSVGVWAHHMYATGVVLLPFFGIVTMLIAVPTGVKFFNWIGTLWGGDIHFTAAMVFALGFLLTFVLGGVTGVIMAAPSLDFALTDSYFVVAHFHYVLFGGGVFALFAGIYYWYPKFTGKKLHEGWGYVQFVSMFIGFNMTFFVQHILGMAGMPRRTASYTTADGDLWANLNLISTIGALILGASTLPFLWNVYRTWRKGEVVGDNPWDAGTLEWWAPSPPGHGNFDKPLPRIRSERPVWDFNHPGHEAIEEEHGKSGEPPGRKEPVRTGAKGSGRSPDAGSDATPGRGGGDDHE